MYILNVVSLYLSRCLKNVTAVKTDLKPKVRQDAIGEMCMDQSPSVPGAHIKWLLVAPSTLSDTRRHVLTGRRKVLTKMC